jgi:hypothetical protein
MIKLHFLSFDMVDLRATTPLLSFFLSLSLVGVPTYIYVGKSKGRHHVGGL